jgi:hypothetical protein
MPIQLRCRIGAVTRARVAAALLTLIAAAGCHGPYPTHPDPSPLPPPAPPVAIVLTPDRWDLPAGGGSLEIIVTTNANLAGSVSAPHVVVTLRASSGSLSADTVETDLTGHARVTWSGLTSTTITATAADLVATSRITVREAANVPPPPPPPGTPPTPDPDPAALLVDLYPEYGPIVAGVPVRLLGAARDISGALVPDVTYEWDFNGDGTAERRGDDRQPITTFAAAGRYVVLLYAHSRDGRAGRGQAALDILPADTAFTASLTVPSGDVDSGATVAFRVTLAPPHPSVDPIQCNWVFGTDGGTTTTVVDGVTTATFAFSPGIHTIGATVTTPDGRTASASAKILVR